MHTYFFEKKILNFADKIRGTIPEMKYDHDDDQNVTRCCFPRTQHVDFVLRHSCAGKGCPATPVLMIVFASALVNFLFSNTAL